MSKIENPQMNGFKLHELDSTYCADKDRFVVSMIVSYDHDPEAEIETPEQAAAAALNLIRGEGCGDTQWYVYDRKTGKMHMIEQHNFDEDFTSGMLRG